MSLSAPAAGATLRTKPRFGADLRADAILDKIPRGLNLREATSKGRLAILYIDVTGALNIVNELGTLKIEENDLKKIHGLEEAFPDDDD